jgi:8-oxo-dGTP pyrophosphatase MutT (NUDIX family)
MNEDEQAVGSGRPFTEDELRLWGTDVEAAKAAQQKQNEWYAKKAKGEGPQASPLQNKKIHGSMHDFKHGKLTDDKGNLVDNRQHAIFLALSRAGMPRTAKHEGKRIYDKTLGQFEKGTLKSRGNTIEDLKHALRLAKSRSKSAEKSYVPKEANERSPYLAAIDRHVEELGIDPMYMDFDGSNASWINDIGHDNVMELDSRMRAEGWGQEKEARDEIVKLTYHKSHKLPYRQRAEVLAYDPETKEIVCRFKRSSVGGLYVELPGGGIDKGEGPKTAAKREALEEAGITLKNIEQVGRCRWKWPKKHQEAMGTWANLYAGDDTYIFIAEVDTKGKPTSEEGDGWDRLQTRSIDKLRTFLKTHKKEGNMIMQDSRLAALRKLENKLNNTEVVTMNKEAFLDGYMNKAAKKADIGLDDYGDGRSGMAGIKNTLANTVAGGGIGAALGGILGRDSSETAAEATGRGAMRGAGAALGANTSSRLADFVSNAVLKNSPKTTRAARIIAGLLGGTVGYGLAADANLSPQEEAEQRLRLGGEESAPDNAHEEKVQAILAKLR